MKKRQFVRTICIVLVSAAAALAQRPRPVPAPPAPPAAPAPLRVFSEDVDADFSELAREQAKMAREFAQQEREMARQMADAKVAYAADLAGQIAKGFAFAPQITLSTDRMSRNGDRAYERGQRALDNRRWDEALPAFTEAAGSGGSRADGALYWKAYALAKLARRDDALAAIAELTKAYPSSRWLNDAKALELEIKQAAGQPVAPGAEDNEELKLLALNGLMQSDAERAIPLVENLLKTSSSPKLRERALFVVAQSDSPRGKQLLEQVARGGAGNPDLQLKAISYVTAASKRTDNKQLLWEIYSAASDDQVKRAILNGLIASGDKEHLLQIAKTDKSTAIRMTAISTLGGTSSHAELWQLYQGETAPEVKQQILSSMILSGGVDRVVEIAKTEKDVRLRRYAIQALSGMRSASANDALVALYGAETDAAVKKSIIQSLRSQNNAKALVDFARKETDPAMKREIVSQLSHMQSKEAADYLMELLK